MRWVVSVYDILGWVDGETWAYYLPRCAAKATEHEEKGESEYCSRFWVIDVYTIHFFPSIFVPSFHTKLSRNRSASSRPNPHSAERSSEAIGTSPHSTLRLHLHP